MIDSEVLIHGGMLLQGIVDKNIVGTSGGSIVHVTWLEKGEVQDDYTAVQCRCFTVCVMTIDDVVCYTEVRYCVVYHGML